MRWPRATGDGGQCLVDTWWPTASQLPTVASATANTTANATANATSTPLGATAQLPTSWPATCHSLCERPPHRCYHPQPQPIFDFEQNTIRQRKGRNIVHDAHQTRHQLSSPSFAVISPSGSLLIPSARFYSSPATFRVHGSTYGPYQHATSTPPFSLPRKDGWCTYEIVHFDTEISHRRLHTHLLWAQYRYLSRRVYC